MEGWGGLPTEDIHHVLSPLCLIKDTWHQHVRVLKDGTTDRDVIWYRIQDPLRLDINKWGWNLFDPAAVAGKDGVAVIAAVSHTLACSLSIWYKETVDTRPIHKVYCSITHRSMRDSIQLHWQHDWSRLLCCGKHFTQRASMLINSPLLIMYLIDQFGPWVNASII